MTRLIFRFLTPLLVVISLLAPLGGGAMAGLLGDARTVVICTGDGLQTLVLGADGTPVETVEFDMPCALVQAADTAQAAINPGLIHTEFTTLNGTIIAHSAPRQAPALPSLPRAPPRA